MQIQQKAGKTKMFPNIMRDANSKAYKHIKRNKSYRRYFEKAVRGLYHKKDYQDCGYLFFLRLYCSLAPVGESFEIFNEITNDSLQFIGQARAECNQKLQNLKEFKQDEDTGFLIRSLQIQTRKIETAEQFLLYLREDCQIDQEIVVEEYLRKLYTINEKTGYNHFTISQQRLVYKMIKEFHETNEKIRIYHKNLVEEDRSRRLNAIREEMAITSAQEYFENSKFDMLK